MFKILRNIPLGPVITALALKSFTGYLSLVGYVEEGYVSVDIDMSEGLLTSCRGKVEDKELGEDCFSRLIDFFCVDCYAEIVANNETKGEGVPVIRKRPYTISGSGELHMCDENVKTELFKSLKTITIESSTPEKLIDLLITSAGRHPLILRMDQTDEELSALLLGKEHKILSACLTKKGTLLEGEDALKAIREIQGKVTGIVSYLSPEKLASIAQYPGMH
jgi:hypothetical protein